MSWSSEVNWIQFTSAEFMISPTVCHTHQKQMWHSVMVCTTSYYGQFWVINFMIFEDNVLPIKNNCNQWFLFELHYAEWWVLWVWYKSFQVLICNVSFKSCIQGFITYRNTTIYYSNRVFFLACLEGIFNLCDKIQLNLFCGGKGELTNYSLWHNHYHWLW